MGSPFASLTVSDRIPLPFDEGQWVQVRKLTGREVERSQESHRLGFAAGSSRAWSVTFRKAIEFGKSDPEVLRAIRDPLTGFDRYELAKAGLVAWSYSQSLTPVTVKTQGEPDRIYNAIDDLGDEEIDFIAREVLKLTKPKLFLETVEEAEADQKKGSARSTATSKGTRGNRSSIATDDSPKSSGARFLQ